MTYRQAQNYLDSFVNYERLNHYSYRSSFRLARLYKLLQLLGSPHRQLRPIHIAGTKGKGSTCAFVAHILSAAGFKTGLYTSPHLVDVRERIKILQKPETRNQKPEKEMISRRDFARLIEKIRPYVERLDKTDRENLSYYELLSCLAFLYFKEERCDFVVLETGLGGRLDATNVVSALVCALTPISYEHTHLLGNTLPEIAKEKAGIIKNRNQIVVIAPQRPAVLKIIRKRVKRCGAKLIEVGKDIRFQQECLNVCGQSFTVKGVFAEYSGLKIRLLGRHQILNAVVALAIVESLQYYGVRISKGAIRRGLRDTCWPGRLQLILRTPRVVLDGAQNQASASALKEALHSFFKFRHLILVFGVSRDKDVQGILRELIPSATRIILTRACHPRAMQPAMIRAFLPLEKRPVLVASNSIRALQMARQSASAQDLILVCGSLFLVGEVLRYLKGEKRS